MNHLKSKIFSAKKYNSRYDGYQQAKKSYLCEQCNHKMFSPKPTACSECGCKSFLKFDSEIEFKRYCELVLMQNCELIKNLKTQVNFALRVNGLLVTTYRADSVYFDCKKNCFVVEDVKPKSKNDKAISNEFKLKAKLFAAIHGFNISIERR